MKNMSVVIPAYNEEKSICRVAETINEVLNKENIPFDIVFVNDGSKDSTWQEICKLSKEKSYVNGVCFSRNFGKESAIFAGLQYAKGDCVVVMDADLQHPPEILIQMYNLWLQGYEVIEGIKSSRGKESLIYKLGAKSFYKIISSATGINMSTSSDFKLMDRKVINTIIELPERHMFFRAISSWVGYKATSVEFEVQERFEGKSKWSFLSLVKYAIRNITSFSTAPMQIVTGCGIIFFFFAIIIGVRAIYQYIVGSALGGFTTVILLLLIIGAVTMLSLGIIGYYISKIYEEVKRRPRYIISKTAGEKTEK
ncbi:glycosyltransferase family 2 protein [Anaerofustis stercorihominis]|uniref:Glycosyltransferase, group 2 family protein n=2 Tax=Anaerofustis stercorihominis TaxID=214853 RepID=B1C819_9FIRM|nr:glycosyltransferase family 2 protein [Anaerofustis stercorihominis]EDS73156.1 glycosyltransferase, group 2 family protein [Anaerofustis stercorihominis DSM 17244]MCQ4794464.1 glycosyltransferase family 2 protein [Anaerofustis stercorihominis]